MKFLLVGDVVGQPGREIICRSARGLKIDLGIDLIVVNAENAAGGSGLTPANYKEFMKAGIDGITLGDHIYRRKEITSVLEKSLNIVKPANYPKTAPGKEWMILQTQAGESVAVISLQGRLFMRPVDCPWEAADRILARLPPEIRMIFIDFHAEATSEKQLLGRFLDGKVTAVMGTHTHVTTADEQIFPGGTAFQCDVGMTGAHQSILGRRIDRVLETTRTFYPTQFEVASEGVKLSGTLVECDPVSGHALSIRRISFGDEEADRLEALGKTASPPSV